MMRFPTKVKFHKWLSAKRSYALVGRSCSLGDCPLATYLREHGATDPYVRPDRVASESCWRSDHAARAALPDWANEFARQLDRFHGRESLVTAEAALAVLEFALRNAAK